MRGTALIYSSHNRGSHIHNDLIVQRALRGNRHILFLPMSETIQNGSEMERQEFSWGTFDWFFQFYDRFGLKAMPFFWTHRLRKEDVDLLWHHLFNDQVVILGGGHSAHGLHRYKELGARFDGDGDKFGRILRERQARGLLTVGFSAGADQLCQSLFSRIRQRSYDTHAFGLVRNVMVTLHHEASDNPLLWEAARQFDQCMAFGLPNDSGLLVDQGWLPSGNMWQVIRFVIDRSWDLDDHWHIRTRWGAKIEHVGAHGIHWSFNGGDTMVRVQSPDGLLNEAWMGVNGELLHYWTRQPSRYRSVHDVLCHH
jgi:hypothetical protein